MSEPRHALSCRLSFGAGLGARRRWSGGLQPQLRALVECATDGRSEPRRVLRLSEAEDVHASVAVASDPKPRFPRGRRRFLRQRSGEGKCDKAQAKRASQHHSGFVRERAVVGGHPSDTRCRASVGRERFRCRSGATTRVYRTLPRVLDATLGPARISEGSPAQSRYSAC